MKLPNPERAVIAPDKLVQYLLNTEHKRGGHKARVLLDFGYNVAHWQQLQSDIRRFHLYADVEVVGQTPYGTRYEIRAPLQTPNGRMLTVRTVWQVDEGTDFPRRITLFPA
jgi:hypothetical protein